ncbi:MAG: lysophospholipase [Bacteroidales bacterium]|nr:lysophospholipase [Bacteroidales bacterium]
MALNPYPREYPAGVLSLKLTDTERGNRKIPVKVFYPEIPPGSNEETGETSVIKFPVICFAHGYQMSADSYGPLCRILTDEGYIVVFPCTEEGVFPSHKTYAADIAFIIARIGDIGTDPSSPLYNRVGPARCLMGHSMGGGASYVAADMGAQADAIVTFAAFNTRPSSIKAAAGVTIPALVFAGSGDCITPPEEHQLPVYHSLASKSKTYILIDGGTHCNMGSDSKKCNAGEKLSGCHNGGLSTEEMTSLIGRYLIPWLRFYLKNDKGSGRQFNQELTNGTGIEYLRSEPLAEQIQ